MTLNFINDSRSYDESRKQIRFVGHDGMNTIPFRVALDAILPEGSANADDEDTILRAFDAKRETIRIAAKDAYSSKRMAAYLLSRSDLR